MATTAKAKRYFIVNPAGAVHEVTRGRAVELVRKPGYRRATKKEREQAMAQKIQRHDKPIAPRWNPEAEIDGDEVE